MKKFALILIPFITIGCATNPDGSVKKSNTGAVIGAVAGAVIGHQIDHKKGAKVGAVLGAGTGAVIGNEMDKQEEAFNRELAAERQANQIQVQRMQDDLLKLTLDSEVSFDVNKSDIKPAFTSSLNKVASVLKGHQGSVTVVGHTDSKGSDSYNQQLSEKRAKSVADYLASQGVANYRLSTMGKGESEPKADNATKEGRAANRRVELLVQGAE